MTPIPSLEEAIPNLFKLLADEKKQLLSGDYSNLWTTSDQKSQYLPVLERHVSQSESKSKLNKCAHDIEKIKNLAQENEALFKSALAGINAAQIRVSRLSERANTVGTYTDDGAKLQNNHSATTRHKLA